MNHSEIVSFLWGVADLIRDTFRRGKYQDVILPLTVLRRLDCVLAPTKEKVLRRQGELRGRGLQDLDAQLRRVSGFAFYNTSRYDFEKLLADAPHLAANLRNYIAGFSPNMREVLEKFHFDNTITSLDEAGLLFQVLERFKKVGLHPETIDNPTMGTIFEELIRKFNEALNENPGEHFTPRDVVHLMVDLMLAGDEERIRRKGVVCTVYDPCCGSGGMLLITKEHITVGLRKNGDIRPPINPGAEIHLFGQEVNPETWAVSKSDLFMKDPTGRDADNIAYGSSLSKDHHAGTGFDYLIANPPYGKDWKRDEDAVRAEHERGVAGRFAPGLPKISDGQLLFLLHMLAHTKAPKAGGSRIAIIMNGSPLFTGDAGSGESEIRRFILENDLLEALIALPEQLFYNTGIATYVWVVTNRKGPARRGTVQLVDATAFWVPMRKSLGDKRREIPLDRAQDILTILADFKDGDTRMVTKDGKKEEVVVSKVFPTTYKDRDEFERSLEAGARKAGIKLGAPVTKAILSALSERDERAAICRDRQGNPEPDPELRDTESVPLAESVETFFEREVKPHLPDAWIDTTRRDERDGKVGVVGYEVNFNRYFYRYTPPRPLEEIEADIRGIEQDILRMLAEVTGSGSEPVPQDQP